MLPTKKLRALGQSLGLSVYGSEIEGFVCIHPSRSLLQKAVLTRPTGHESSAGAEARVGETGEEVTGIARVRV